jgi:hypothetical protein
VISDTISVADLIKEDRLSRSKTRLEIACLMSLMSLMVFHVRRSFPPLRHDQRFEH